MYSSKQRTGVLDLETGLEAYIIPPCLLVDRLLKTAKKSAALASHSAVSIPDTIEDSQLLLAVIHRKVCTVTITVVNFVPCLFIGKWLVLMSTDGACLLDADFLGHIC